MQLQNKFLKDYRRLYRLIESGTVFTAIDTETTGLNYRTDRIIEIGAVRFDKSGVLSTFQSLIKSDITAKSSEITGITSSMLEDAPLIEEMLPQVRKITDGSILLGHNLHFDLYFLNTEAERCGQKMFLNKALDTLCLSRWAYPENQQFKLQALARQFDIKVEAAHRAFDDARVCMELFKRILKDTMAIQKKIMPEKN